MEPPRLLGRCWRPRLGHARHSLKKASLGEKEAPSFVFTNFANDDGDYYGFSQVPAIAWIDAAEALILLELADLFFYGASTDAK
jgi:hypothetical protein